MFHHDILIEFESYQDDAQDHRGDDEKVADLGRGLRGMRSPAAGGRHQAGGAAKKGVVARPDHHRVHLTLLGDTAGVALVTDLLAHRQGLAGQRGLVDTDVLSFDEAYVGGYDFAQLDPQHVSGDDLGGVDGRELPIAQGRGLGSHARFQCGQGIGGLAFLPKARDGVVEQQHQDDGEIGPVPHQQRQQGGGLDHPGDRPPEKAQKLLQVAGFLFHQLVAAVFFEPLFRFGRREPLGRGCEFFIYRVKTRLFQVLRGPGISSCWLIVFSHVRTSYVV